MSPRHPYAGLPDTAYWRRAVAGTAAGAVDPVTRVPFRLTRQDRVATAGSCFAQHIARHLAGSGYRYHVTEPAPPLVTPDEAFEWNYGTFSARYGNLYTVRQLRQLFARAFGRLTPADDVWPGADGGLIDPYRPQIQPGGFACAEEFAADRAAHLAAVRRMFETLDVFVFTLGLTEAWLNAADGAVYPVCPGVSGGTFDPARHVFHNFTLAEVLADLTAFIADDLRGVNPGARVILTVSPVPLMATASDNHVLAATTYSKSVLRVACEEASRTLPDVAYFPSYEIITGQHAGNAYYAADLRSVREEGVAHVMGLFLHHFGDGSAPPPAAAAGPAGRADTGTAEMERLMRLHCEESALDPGA